MNRFLAYTALFAAIFVSGCTGLGLDETSEFSCNKEPGTNYCISSDRIYELSEGNGDLKVALEKEAAKIEAEKNGEEWEEDLPVKAEGLARPEVVLPTFEQPLTLINLPEIVRVFVAPYEDEKGNLHMNGYMIVKAKDWSWSVGDSYDRFIKTNTYPHQVSSLESQQNQPRPNRANQPPQTKRPANDIRGRIQKVN